MSMPTSLIISNAAYALDGGSIVLIATDEAGMEHFIALAQHAFPRSQGSDAPIPGRLYFDGELIMIRSEREADVLTLCRSAQIEYVENSPDTGEESLLSENTVVLGEDIQQVLDRGPEDNLRAMRDQIIQFVESDAYIRFADSVE